MDQDLIRTFRAEARRLERIIGDYLHRDTCCHGVSIAQCHTLLAVEQLSKPSLGALVETLELDKSTVSRTVEGLVQGNLLMREVDLNDRRIVRISLTPKGQGVCDGINRSNDKRYSAILAAITRDPRDVVQMFSELVQAMAQAESLNEQCPVAQDKRT